MTLERLRHISQSFQETAENKRLRLLLSYAAKVPALPEHLQAHGFFIEEGCKTPFYIATEVNNGKVMLYFDAPKEASSTWAFGGILYEAFQGKTPEDVLASPNDIHLHLGLNDLLGTQRLMQLAVMQMKLKLELHKALQNTPTQTPIESI